MAQLTREVAVLWRSARRGHEMLVVEVPDGWLTTVEPVANPWAPATEASRCQVAIPRSGRLGRLEFHRCKRRTRRGIRCWQHLRVREAAVGIVA